MSLGFLTTEKIASQKQLGSTKIGNLDLRSAIRPEALALEDAKHWSRQVRKVRAGYFLEAYKADEDMKAGRPVDTANAALRYNYIKFIDELVKIRRMLPTYQENLLTADNAKNKNEQFTLAEIIEVSK